MPDVWEDKSEAKLERIGILLVHGIGDQVKNAHLQLVGDHFVKTLALMHGAHSIAVEIFPGLDGKAPLSILVDANGRKLCLDFYEMWWRDLGERPKTSSLFKFWLWALSLAGTRGYFHSGTGPLTPPDNYSVRWGGILPHDRLLLFAKTTYFFVLLAPLAIVLQLLTANLGSLGRCLILINPAELVSSAGWRTHCWIWQNENMTDGI
jgi:hypothetical protein